MLNSILENLYFRIYLSKLYPSLQQLDELYLQGDHNAYLRQLNVLLSRIRALPGNSRPDIAHIYDKHAPLMESAGQLATGRHVSETNAVASQLREFVDDLYNAINPPMKTIMVKRIRLAVLAVAVLACVAFYRPLKKQYAAEKQQYNLIAAEEEHKQRTIKDIQDLKEALDKYHKDHNSYPKSTGWDAVVAAWGESRTDWIRGLAPRYIKTLPSDPRKSDDSGKQYMYKSNGIDFKLIAQNPPGIDEIVKIYPDMVDPARPSWAFGVWTEGAKNW